MPANTDTIQNKASTNHLSNHTKDNLQHDVKSASTQLPIISQSRPHSRQLLPDEHRKPQFDKFHGSSQFGQTKCLKGIDGQIYILNATTIPTQPSVASSTDVPHMYPHVFSAFYDLPVIHTDSTLHA